MEKNRIIQIQVYLANHRDTEVTSQQLAALTGVTAKTIKSDIHDINEDLVSKGARVLSKRSSGYRLEVTDTDVFERYKEWLDLIDYYQLSFNEYDDTVIMTQILRMLLTTKPDGQYLKVSELPEVLFISKAAFNRIYKRCVWYLGSYCIAVRAVPGKGSFVVGHEIDIRMALLSLSDYLSVDGELAAEDDGYARIFDDADFKMIRKRTLDVLRRRGYTVREDTPRGLSRYMVVMKKRLATGHALIINSDQRALIDESMQKGIAAEIIADIPLYKDLGVTEDEVRGLAIYLMCNHDFAPEEVAEIKASRLKRQVASLHHAAQRFISENFGLGSEVRQVDRYLYSILAKTVIRSQFGMAAYGSILGSYHHGAMRRHVVELQAARITAAWLERQLDVYCNMNVLTSLAYYFDKSLQHISYSSAKKRIATVSPLGIRYAEILAKEIDDRFGENIASNKVMELYEIRALPPGALDLVVLENGVLSYYNYPIPVFVLTDTNIDDLGSQLCGQQTVDEYASQIDRLLTTVEHPQVMSADEWMSELAHRHSCSKAAAEAMEGFFRSSNARFRYSNLGRILFLEPRRELTNARCIEIYRLGSRQLWNGVHADYLIYYALGGDPLLMKAFAGLCAQLMAKVSVMDSLFKCKPDERSQIIIGLLEDGEAMR